MRKVLILEGSEVVGDFELQPSSKIDEALIDKVDVIIGVDEEGHAQFMKHPVAEIGKQLSHTWNTYITAIAAQEAIPEHFPRALVLSDTDPFPYGKHKGVMMKAVPARYYHWCWNKFAKEKVGEDNVANYINKNRAALEKELPDAIWD
jgi:hypothetical protein